jgi:hypothetical protein
LITILSNIDFDLFCNCRIFGICKQSNESFTTGLTSVVLLLFFQWLIAAIKKLPIPQFYTFPKIAIEPYLIIIFCTIYIFSTEVLQEFDQSYLIFWNWVVLQIDRYVFLILKSTLNRFFNFSFDYFELQNRTFENQHHLHLANFYLQKYLEKLILLFLLNLLQSIKTYQVWFVTLHVRSCVSQDLLKIGFLELLDNPLKYL